MRNLTICLVAFAVAFALCGIAFRTVVSAEGKFGREAASEQVVPARLLPGAGGVPALRDDELY
jgi:hypothetical protein